MLFIGGALVSSAPTQQGCTNTARMHQHSAHAACIEAEQAAVERGDGSRSCKCTHNKRITAIISFFIICQFERIR